MLQSILRCRTFGPPLKIPGQLTYGHSAHLLQARKKIAKKGGISYGAMDSSPPQWCNSCKQYPLQRWRLTRVGPCANTIFKCSQTRPYKYNQPLCLPIVSAKFHSAGRKSARAYIPYDSPQKLSSYSVLYTYQNLKYHITAH